MRVCVSVSVYVSEGERGCACAYEGDNNDAGGGDYYHNANLLKNNGYDVVNSRLRSPRNR